MNETAKLYLPDATILEFIKLDEENVQVGSSIYSLYEARKLWQSKLERGAVIIKKVLENVY